MQTPTSSIIFTTKSKNQTSPSDVEVKLDPSYNRKRMESLEHDIQDTWKRRLNELPSLFNGTKFRLHSVEENGDKVTLNIGITCYRDFQGTNLSKDILLLQSQGLCDHDDSQAYMSDALGVGALVQTADNHMVLLFRSKNCGEDTELWDRPGGHAEPKVSKVLNRCLWLNECNVIGSLHFTYQVCYPIVKVITIFYQKNSSTYCPDRKVTTCSNSLDNKHASLTEKTGY